MPPIQTALTLFQSIENHTIAGIPPQERARTAARRRQRTGRVRPQDRPERPTSAQHNAPHARTFRLLQVTLEGIEKIDVFVTRIQQTLLQAKAAARPEARVSLAQRYETLCEGVDLCTQSASYAGLNLIDGNGQQEVISFCRNTPSRFVIIHTDLTAGSTGLNLPHAAAHFKNDEDIVETLRATHAARQRLTWARAHIEQSLQVLRWA